MITAETIKQELEILKERYTDKGAVELEDPYQVLFATIISQRTRDETTEVIAAKVFQRYPSVYELAEANQEELEKLLYLAGFYREKSKKMIKCAQEIVSEFHGIVPDTVEKLTSLTGVGRKTANCVLVYAFDKPAIIVDTHVFRIPQRLGWLTSKNVDQAEKSLEKIVPQKYWTVINRVMVKFGKDVCKPIGPRHAACPLLPLCPTGQEALSIKK